MKVINEQSKTAYKAIVLLVSLMMLQSVPMHGQSSGNKDKKFISSIFLTEGYGGTENELSLPGASYELAYSFSDRTSLLFSTRLLLWNKQEKNTISFNLGPQFRIADGEKWFVDVHAEGGVILIVGNDYAGGFGNFLGGLKVGKKLRNNKALLFGLGVDHAMAFNSGFTYAMVSIGYQL